MALIVQKYGGTSVGNPERIRHVARRILDTQRAGNKVVAVVSAMSGVTNSLLDLANAVSTNPTERELDVLLATGEQLLLPVGERLCNCSLCLACKCVSSMRRTSRWPTRGFG